MCYLNKSKREDHKLEQGSSLCNSIHVYMCHKMSKQDSFCRGCRLGTVAVRRKDKDNPRTLCLILHLYLQHGTRDILFYMCIERLVHADPSIAACIIRN